jgi:hypothetical protein
VSTKPGLKLALEFIDSRLRTVQDLRGSMGIVGEQRLDGAATVLKDLRERIVRAIGPDDE